jgi:hypothetical protein
VKPPRPNDDHLSGALRAALARSASARAEGCPDPSLLAGYAERRLAVDELSAWDAHVSTCSRCQATIAAIVRSGSLEPQRAWSWPSLPALRWAVPATAAATALGLWLMVERPARGPATGAVDDAGQVAGAERDPPTSDGRPPALDRLASTESVRQTTRNETGQRANSGVQAKRADERRTLGSRRESAPASSDGAAPRPPAAQDRAADAARIEPPRQEASTASAAAPPAAAAPPRAPAQPAGAGGAPASALEEKEAEFSREAIGAVASSPGERAASEGARPDAGQDAVAELNRARSAPQGRLAMPTSLEIRTPDPGIRWRVTGSFVERSTDGGATWTGQRLDAGMTIFAGSAPSPLVAWLAGTQGFVYRTTDGATWTRVSPPSADDLIAIEATSPSAATVTTRAGARYGTTDAGRTWSVR